MKKEELKKLLCATIDNIPDYAEIEDCYIEHGYSEQTATIKIVIKNLDSNKRIDFHNLAHDSFNTDMDLIS